MNSLNSTVVVPTKYLSYQEDMDDISQFRKISNSSVTCDSRGELTSSHHPHNSSVRYNLSLLSILFFLLLILVGLAGGIVGRLLSPVCTSGAYQSSKPSKNDLTNDELDISLAEVILATGKRVPIVRLPTHIRPDHYDLHFKLIDRTVISGTVAIRVICSHSTMNISLHAKNLELGTVEVLDSMRNSLTIDRLENSSDTAIITIHLAQELAVTNAYVIRAAFQLEFCSYGGPISCNFDDIKNTFTFATKLEPIKARELFPCFDEPSFKATYNVTVSYQPRLFHTILTNEALYNRKFHNGHVTDHFYRSPKMSTYLLALAGGDFRSRCAPSLGSSLKLCLWAEPEDISQLDFALTTTAEMFEAIQSYFPITYPLRKLDILGLHTYPTGAMENWGLIVHNFNTLSVGSLQHDSLRFRQFVISKIICHEILHQWFGNLVTMEWWDELWLNEGFATFYSYHFLKTKYPDLVELDLIRQLIHLLNLQSKTDSKMPLLIDFHSTTDVDEIFDPYHLYSKGAMVVKILFDLLGEKPLKSSLTEYLTTFAYKSVTRHNLVGILVKNHRQNVINVDIEQLINKWVTNPGYPEVQLVRDYHNNEIVITQRPADAERHKTGVIDHWETSNATWPLPLLYMIKGQPVPNVPSVWTNDSLKRFTELSLKANSWILANSGLQFPYRVNYDLTNWKLLIEQLHSNHREIPFASRIQLIEDSEFFLKLNSNLISFLDLLGYLVYETEEAVIRQSLPKLESVLLLFRGTSLYPLLQTHFGSILAQYVKVSPKGFESACRLLCATNNPVCNAKSQILPYSEDYSRNNNVSSYCDTVHMCHHFQSFSTKEEMRRLAEHSDKLKGMTLRTVITCSSNRSITDKLLDSHLQSYSWAWIPATLASPYSLVHNPIAYHSFWKGLVKLGKAQVKEMLQAELLRDGVNIIGAISSLSDLQIAKSILPNSYSKALEGVERRLEWIQEVTPSVQAWFIKNLNIIESRRKAFRTLKG